MDPVVLGALTGAVLYCARWAYQSGRAAEARHQARHRAAYDAATSSPSAPFEVTGRSEAGKVRVTVGGRTFDVDESLARERP